MSSNAFFEALDKSKEEKTKGTYRDEVNIRYKTVKKCIDEIKAMQAVNKAYDTDFILSCTVYMKPCMETAMNMVVKATNGCVRFESELYNTPEGKRLKLSFEEFGRFLDRTNFWLEVTRQSLERE